MFCYTKPDLDWSGSGPDKVAIQAQKNTTLSFFPHSIKHDLDSIPKSWIFFLLSPSPRLEPQLCWGKKNPIRILSDAAIYPCIDNPYRLNKHKG
jgi:hypothetical protein